MKSTTHRNITTILALLLIPATLAFAASKEELQKRFKQRYPELKELKQAGTIGETSEGFVDFVKDRDSKAAKTVDSENADRKELYALVAKETNVTPEDVAARNAKRNHDKLQPGEYYKGEDGKWTKK